MAAAQPTTRTVVLTLLECLQDLQAVCAAASLPGPALALTTRALQLTQQLVNGEPASLPWESPMTGTPFPYPEPGAPEPEADALAEQVWLECYAQWL